MPAITLAINSDPRRSSQRCSALFASLNTIDKILARETHPRVLGFAAAPSQRSTQSDWSYEDESSVQPESHKRSAMHLYPYSGTQPPSGISAGRFARIDRRPGVRSPACPPSKSGANPIWLWVANAWAVCSTHWRSYAPSSAVRGFRQTLAAALSRNPMPHRRRQAWDRWRDRGFSIQQYFFPGLLRFAKSVRQND